MTCEKNEITRDFSAVLDTPKILEVTTSKIDYILEVTTSKIDYMLNISFRSGDFQWLKAPKSDARFKSTIELQINDAAEELGITRTVAYVEGDALA